jgi:hypothetical protein
VRVADLQRDKSFSCVDEPWFKFFDANPGAKLATGVSSPAERLASI